jgi:signal transduction histidine kinase
MSDLTELLSRHPSARNQQLSVTGLDEDVTAAINGTDFLQILLNLTINALQSTADPHSVDVTCRLLTAPIIVDQYPDGPRQRVINRENFANRPPLLAITIEDTGPGIPAENLRRMFEERFTTKPSDQGTGLGLSIVKRLIKEADGAVVIQSEPGAGAKFTVYLQTVR